MVDNWEELNNLVSKCSNCGLCSNNKKIFENGNRNADVMFVGDFPDREDATKSLSFSGIQGQLLDKVFEGIGINKNNVYLTNVLKCIPSEMPKNEEIKACMNILRNQVMLIKPKIIVLMGKIANMNILGNENILGNFQEKKGILYLSTNSIMELYKYEDKKIDFWNHIKKLKKHCEENNYKI